jgi:hypothetical protein
MARPDDFDEPATSGKAIAGLVCGLLAFCIPCLPALLAILFGALGLADIARNPGRLTGKILAVGGMAAGVLGTVFLTVVGVIAYPHVKERFAKKPAEQAAPETVDWNEKFQLASQRTQSANNLKQLALAMHSYHDEHQRFPPQAQTGKDGRPLLSWRVLVLKYLGPEERSLFDEFHLDEPWDSPHNKALLPRMPKVYASPRPQPGAEPYTTYYQVFVGKPRVNLRPIFVEGEPPASMTLLINADGSSFTILIAEAGEPVPWTKPADLSYSPSAPLPRLGGIFDTGFHVALADGSVRMVPKGAAESVIRDLITYNDGHPVNPPWSD